MHLWGHTGETAPHPRVKFRQIRGRGYRPCLGKMGTKKAARVDGEGGAMNTNLNMQRMPIDRLKPAKYNPRKDLKPGDPAYEKIKRSLHDFGYVDPIVWNEVTGNIVGGHQRYKVLVNEGAAEVDCVVVHIENPQDEKALNIALNKATGDWEPTALADILQDPQLSGYDLGATICFQRCMTRRPKRMTLTSRKS